MLPNNTSLYLQLVANLVPIYGVYILGWSIDSVIIGYFIETMVIFFFTFFKIWVSQDKYSVLSGPLRKSVARQKMEALLVNTVSCLLSVAVAWLVFKEKLTGQINLASLIPIVGSFLVSHAYNFFANFIGQKQYQYTNPEEHTAIPSLRVLVINTLLFVSASINIFLLFILLKIIIDWLISSHERQVLADKT